MRASLVALLGLGFVFGGACLVPARSSSAPGTRVGVFERVKVLPAFYRSAIWAKRMKEIKTEAEGAALQDRAHKQLMGEMPIDEVLAPLAKEWPAIAKEAGVSAIVEQLLFRDEGVELVDVSENIAKRFSPAKGGR